MPPPADSPIAIIGLTAVNVTPCSSGSRTPIFQKPTDWMIDAMPQVNRSALMRWTSSSVQAERTGHQDRHQHGAGVERQHVLEAVRGELRDGQHLVDGVDPPFRRNSRAHGSSSGSAPTGSLTGGTG